MSARAKRSLLATVILIVAVGFVVMFVVKAGLMASSVPVISVQTEDSDDCPGSGGGACLGPTPPPDPPKPPCKEEGTTGRWGAWENDYDGALAAAYLEFSEDTISEDNSADYNFPEILGFPTPGSKIHYRTVTTTCPETVPPSTFGTASVAYSLDSWWEWSRLLEPGICEFYAEAQGISSDAICANTGVVDAGIFTLTTVTASIFSADNIRPVGINFYITGSGVPADGTLAWPDGSSNPVYAPVFSSSGDHQVTLRYTYNGTTDTASTTVTAVEVLTISPKKSVIPIGTTLTKDDFTIVTSPAGHEELVTVSPLTFPTAGKSITVTATCGASSDTCTITVVRVDSIALVETPRMVQEPCPYFLSRRDFTIKTYPTGYPDMVELDPDPLQFEAPGGPYTVTGTCGTSTAKCSFNIYQLVMVYSGSKSSEGLTAEERTLFLANDYLDLPAKRKDVVQDVHAIVAPCDLDGLAWDEPYITPSASPDATFTEKAQDNYTATYSGFGASKSMNLAICGVDIVAPGVSAEDEEDADKTYNIFLNENFSKGVASSNLDGHSGCMKPDNQVESSDPATDEMGTISIDWRTYGDSKAMGKLSGFDGKARIYVNNVLYDGSEQSVDNFWVGATIRVEGIAEGTFTLTATLTTNDNFTATDKVKMEVVKFNINAANIAGLDDQHEICDKKLILPVSTGSDTQFIEITIDKPNNVTDAQVNQVLTLNVPGNIALYSDQNTSTKVTSVTFSELPKTLYAVGTALSASILDSELEVSMSLNSGVVCRDSIKFTVMKTDLDAMRIGGADNQPNGELPEAQEDDPGAFVPVNSDDDDANDVADKDQAGAIVGESDLLPIILHKTEPTIEGSKYTLAGSSASHIKLWKNANRSEQASLTTEINADTDTTLYVEGRDVGSDTIQLNWKFGDAKIDKCDTVKVTVFEWEGAMNVPDYSIQKYIASGALDSSQWIAPVNGSIKPIDNSSDINILWMAGPAIGKAVYQVNDDYIWGLEVNIVQVDIVSPGGGAFYAGTPLYEGEDMGRIYGPWLRSGYPGMEWTATVVLNGPEANNVTQRGVTHIEIGYIQNLNFTTISCDYTVDTSNKTLTGSIQQKEEDFVLDTVSEATGSYYQNNAVFQPVGKSQDARTKYNFTFHDSPMNDVPRHYMQQKDLQPSGDGKLTHIKWTDTFILWITAHSDQTENDIDDIYTCRARVDWKFIIDEDYNGDATPPDTPMHNPLPHSSVTVPAPKVWTPVVDGSVPKRIRFVTANTLLETISFK